jgi:transketolase
MPLNDENYLAILNERARDIKKLILKAACRQKAHHIGTSLSMADILAVLYFGIMNFSAANASDPDRDRFVLSKGHGALGLYSALSVKDLMSESEFMDNFNADGGRLGVHPDFGSMPGIEISSGSLGHGLSIGAGMALAAKMDGRAYQVFVMLGDGELNEGAVWEGVLFAAHHRLDNLIAIIDYNRWQAFGRTDEVMGLDPLPEKWQAFGWDVKTINGHDVGEIYDALKKAKAATGRPTVIIANTKKGKGAYFEDTLESHYHCISEEELEKILSRI